MIFLLSQRYERVDEIIWVKTNQLQRIIRTGRTGHWLNHGKEHCLVCWHASVIRYQPVIHTVYGLQLGSCPQLFLFFTCSYLEGMKAVYSWNVFGGRY